MTKEEIVDGLMESLSAGPMSGWSEGAMSDVRSSLESAYDYALEETGDELHAALVLAVSVLETVQEMAREQA